MFSAARRDGQTATCGRRCAEVSGGSAKVVCEMRKPPRNPPAPPRPRPPGFRFFAFVRSVFRLSAHPSPERAEWRRSRADPRAATVSVTSQSAVAKRDCVGSFTFSPPLRSKAAKAET